MHNRDSCYGCDCWDLDREGCTMPSCDLSYACSDFYDESEFFKELLDDLENGYIDENEYDHYRER